MYSNVFFDFFVNSRVVTGTYTGVCGAFLGQTVCCHGSTGGRQHGPKYRRRPGASWGFLGGVLERLGAVLEVSWSVSGAAWASRGGPGASQSVLKASWKRPGSSWGPLGVDLGRLGSGLEASWSVSGASWRRLGTLGTIWSVLGAAWKRPGASRKAQAAQGREKKIPPAH